MKKPIFKAALVAMSLLVGMMGDPPDAGARPVRNTTRTNVTGARNTGANRNVGTNRNVGANQNVNANRNVNANVNRNVNVNQNVNVHRDIDVDVDHGHYGHDHYHPVATAVGVAAVATVTAVAIGSIVNTLPPSCSAVVSGGITYQQCGSTYYQPRYSGTQVSYVVVNPP